jgi:hemerythrin superfamily protein
MKTSQFFRRIPIFMKPLVGAELDAIQLLERDHIQVESLYMAYQMAKDSRRRSEIFSRLRDLITLHADIEEDIWYPACAKHEELRKHVKESIEEHKQIRSLLSELSARSISDENQQARVKVLMDILAHHVEEEETHFFPKARREFSPRVFAQLTRQIRESKEGTRRPRIAATARRKAPVRARSKVSKVKARKRAA